MRKAFREIPMMSKNLAPTKANNTEMINAIAAALPAIFFL